MLKVSVPTSFALMGLANRVPNFLLRYPEVQLQMNLDDRCVDLVEGGYDCAPRFLPQKVKVFLDFVERACQD